MATGTFSSELADDGPLPAPPPPVQAPLPQLAGVAAPRAVEVDADRRDPGDDLSWPDRLLGNREVPSWAVSAVVHAAVLLALALWSHASTGSRQLGRAILLSPAEAEVGGVDSSLASADNPQGLLADPTISAAPLDPLDVSPSPQPAVVPTLPTEAEPPTEPVDTDDTPRPQSVLHDGGNSAAIRPDRMLEKQQAFVAGANLAGRKQYRQRTDNLTGVKPGTGSIPLGSTVQGEQAMNDGLRWLAVHQNENGSWLFDFRDGPCQGQCHNPGKVATSTGATGLAIMAFLSAGHTHQDGPYREVVGRGLRYLASRALITTEGADLQEGTMYAQGIATLALAEAYALTKDSELRPVAQGAVTFIVNAQNKRTGGWRYVPGQPGDTTVLGWQVMALRSADLAGLTVPPATIHQAGYFLDSVQSGDGAYLGAFYGYQSRERTDANTAIGLLCRMYMGWPRDHKPLQHGVAWLAKLGPSRSDMYFNFYATQVLHHVGGPPWKSWNARMRDYLVATQSRAGHESGSWHFDDRHGRQAGRLYNTALATMTLQVYYRYLPLYQESSVLGFQK